MVGCLVKGPFAWTLQVDTDGLWPNKIPPAKLERCYETCTNKYYVWDYIIRQIEKKILVYRCTVWPNVFHWRISFAKNLLFRYAYNRFGRKCRKLCKMHITTAYPPLMLCSSFTNQPPLLIIKYWLSELINISLLKICNILFSVFIDMEGFFI